MERHGLILPIVAAAVGATSGLLLGAASLWGHGVGVALTVGVLLAGFGMALGYYLTELVVGLIWLFGIVVFPERWWIVERPSKLELASNVRT